MRKFLFLILISILMTGCSNDKSKSAADLPGSASQALYETQPSVTTQAQPPKEPLKLQYPQILTPASIVSYERIGQAAGNHEESDLVKSADLFYDKNGKPYNKDTILNADYVTEYWRDDKQVTVEEYNRDADRYKLLLDFLL